VPASLQKGSQEIQTHQDVGLQFVVAHFDVSNGSSEAGNLLELEFDGGAEVFDLGGEGLVVGDNLGESLDSVQNGSADDRHLLQDGVRGEQDGVGLGPLFDEFLVLVELLEVVQGGVLNINVVLLDLFFVLGVSDNAKLEVGAGYVGQTH